jgi:hypothetical protein
VGLWRCIQKIPEICSYSWKNGLEWFLTREEEFVLAILKSDNAKYRGVEVNIQNVIKFSENYIVTMNRVLKNEANV